jgi:hypothetical protein
MNDTPEISEEEQKLKDAHAVALQEWLDQILQDMIPYQDRITAQNNPAYVRAFLRAKKLSLARVGNTQNFVLLRKRKVIAKFVFQVNVQIKNEPVTQDQISKN